MASPYENQPVEKWDDITQSLLKKHPLKKDEIVETVKIAWGKIFLTRIGGELKIGKDVFPSPQILGDYLHLLIAHDISKLHPTEWRPERDKNDKDLVCLTDDSFSLEIKTSSQNKIFGNRSYGQKESETGKSKSGYYLAVLFEKSEPDKENPQIKLIKFGWIDHTDWKAQNSPTGQNSTLSSDAWNHKMLTFYEYDPEFFDDLQKELQGFVHKEN